MYKFLQISLSEPFSWRFIHRKKTIKAEVVFLNYHCNFTQQSPFISMIDNRMKSQQAITQWFMDS